MGMGMQVKICDLPQTHREKVRGEKPELGIVYRLFYNAGGAPGDTFEYVRLRNHQQGEPSEYESLMQILAQSLPFLPDDVVALGYTNTGLAVYWREKGGPEQVDVIYQELSKLKSALDSIPIKSSNE
jgi:hypothetical protein